MDNILLDENDNIKISDLGIAAIFQEEDEKPEPHILINPVITSRSKTMIEVEEGCLSFPDVYEKVLRHEKVTVEYMDTKGKKKKINAKDIEAVVLQHEIDHLDGIVFLDRVEEQK